jgi:hypothetical protein
MYKIIIIIINKKVCKNNCILNLFIKFRQMSVKHIQEVIMLIDVMEVVYIDSKVQMMEIYRRNKIRPKICKVVIAFAIKMPQIVSVLRVQFSPFHKSLNQFM